MCVNQHGHRSYNKENKLKIPLGPGIGQCCGGFVEMKLTKHSNFKNAIKNEVFDAVSYTHLTLPTKA